MYMYVILLYNKINEELATVYSTKQNNIITIFIVQFVLTTPTHVFSSAMDGDCLWRRLARPARVVVPRAMRSRKKKKNGASSEWSGLGVPDLIATALLEAGFTKPTEIQSRAITTALSQHCDVIGASETVCAMDVCHFHSNYHIAILH